MRRHLIILSGSLADTPLLRVLIRDCSHVVAADGGSDHARRIGLKPHLAVGDLDSITPEGRAWLDASAIPVNVYPPEKDATDSEIALAASLAAIPAGTPPESVELVFLGALGSRPDHVLGNQMMAASLAARGYRVLISDGLSILWAMQGPDSLAISLDSLPPENWAFSVVALSPIVSGLTYTGLKYPLDRFTLPFGSSRGISNEPAAGVREITVRIESGLALACLTPRD